jgi:hypothetical protein
MLPRGSLCETGVPKFSRQQAEALWKMIEEGGFTRENVQDCLRTMMRKGGEGEDDEQETVSSGSMTGAGADPDPHRLPPATVARARFQMDSLHRLYAAGHMCTRDYENGLCEIDRFGRRSNITAEGARSFNALYGPPCRQGY